MASLDATSAASTFIDLDIDVADIDDQLVGRQVRAAGWQPADRPASGPAVPD